MCAGPAPSPAVGVSILDPSYTPHGRLLARRHWRSTTSQHATAPHATICNLTRQVLNTRSDRVTRRHHAATTPYLFPVPFPRCLTLCHLSLSSPTASCPHAAPQSPPLLHPLAPNLLPRHGLLLPLLAVWSQRGAL